jgi:hypothetical protein
MKIFLFAFMCFAKSLYASIDSIPQILVNEKSPRWSYLIQDDNFKLDHFGNARLPTKYNACGYLYFILDNNNLYMNNPCVNGDRDYYGNMFVKLDLKTSRNVETSI